MKGLALILAQFYDLLPQRIRQSPALRPWCWERLRVGDRDNRGLDGWIASPTQWTWAWANSGRWWRTGKSGMLQSTGSQKVGHDWATEQHLLCSLQTTGGTTGDSQPLRPLLSLLFGPPYLICPCPMCPPLGVELHPSKLPGQVLTPSIWDHGLIWK